MKKITVALLVGLLSFNFLAAADCFAISKKEPTKIVKVQKEKKAKKLVKVDLNKATEEELVQNKAFSKKVAQEVIAYRTQNGEFKSVDDLLKVKGMTDKKLNRAKKHLFI